MRKKLGTTYIILFTTVSVGNTYLTVPTLPKTKKERIRELTLAGLDPKDIASKLNTTLDYVYKEKGKYKREGQLITQQSLSLSNGFREITIKKNNEPKEAMKLENHGQAYEPIIERSDYDLPPLDTDAIINM